MVVIVHNTAKILQMSFEILCVFVFAFCICFTVIKHKIRLSAYDFVMFNAVEWYHILFVNTPQLMKRSYSPVKDLSHEMIKLLKRMWCNIDNAVYNAIWSVFVMTKRATRERNRSARQCFH